MLWTTFLHFCKHSKILKSLKKSIFQQKFHKICEISGSQINYCHSSTTSLHPHHGVSCLQPQVLQVQDPCQRVLRAPRSASEYPRLFTRPHPHLTTGSPPPRSLQGRPNPPRPHMEANQLPLRTLAYPYLQIMAFRPPGKAFFILQGLHLW